MLSLILHYALLQEIRELIEKLMQKSILCDLPKARIKYYLFCLFSLQAIFKVFYSQSFFMRFEITNHLFVMDAATYLKCAIISA